MNPLHMPQAFPAQLLDQQGQPIHQGDVGMSLWAYFAAAALSGADPNDPQVKAEWAAKNAADYADAMMREHNARIGAPSSADRGEPR